MDLELYRKEVPLNSQPFLRLSVIDISPDHPHKTLVFLHGFGGRATQWQYQLAHFSISNRVIAIDLRGHGQSSKLTGTFSLAQILSDLEAVLDRLGVAGRFVLIGHSFGGAIATEYAAAHAERIDSLVLIAAAGEYKLNWLYRLGLHLPVPILKLLAPIFGSRLGAPPHVLKSWYINSLSKWNGWSLFQNLQAPTLVIRGHLDLVLERPMFAEVARTVPNAVEIDLGFSGHMVMLERREAVNRAIEGFLGEKPLSWRETDSLQEASARAALVRARPWLSSYDDRVPFTIAVPRVPLHQLLLSASRRFPRRTALLFEGLRISYQRLNLESDWFCNALRALGVRKGNRVMLLLPNLPQAVVAFFGVLKSGAVAVFAMPTNQEDGLARQMLDSEARLLVTLSQRRDLARRVINRVKHSLPTQDLETEAGMASPFQIILTDAGDYLPFWKRLALHRSTAGKPLDRPEGFQEPEEYLLRALLTVHHKGLPEDPITPDDLAVIQYTGGTTADPKGVMLTHYNLVANALQTRLWIPETRDGRERFLCVLPFAHSYGLTAALNAPIAMGATLILRPKFETADVLKTIQRYRPTIFPGVPQMYVSINDYPGVRKYGIQSIKACISGSAPLPVEVQEAFEKLTHGHLVEGYGLTEASPVTHANPLHDRRKVGSIGVPLPSTEACLLDLVRGREEVPLGQIGELAIRGPQVMKGYWNNPQATHQVITPDGWLLTGDVAQMDEEGYFRIVARKADLWYPSKPGQPAFPRDVEEVLYEIPQVKEAVVVAVAGQPIAFIIARKQRPTAEAVIAYTRRRLPPELVPKLVIFMDEFPRSFVGKVLRKELEKRAEGL